MDISVKKSQLLQFIFLGLVGIFPLMALIRVEWAWILLLFPIVLTIQGAVTGRMIPKTPMLFGIILIGFMVLVSLYATFDMAFSFPKIAGITYGITLFITTLHTSQTEQSFRNILILYLLVGFGMAGVSLLNIQARTRIPLLGPIIARLPDKLFDLPGIGHAINSNEIAGFLQWVTPLSLILSIGLLIWLIQNKTTTYNRIVVWGGFIILATGSLFFTALLAISQSRGGILGFIAGIAITSFLLIHKWHKTLAWGFTIGLLIILLAVGSSTITTLLFPNAETTVNTDIAAIAGVDGRLEIWSRAIYGIQDFSITGMGIGTFRRVVPILYPLFSISPSVDIAHAHSHLLQVALDLGIPGLIGYLAIWMAAIFMLGQVWFLSDHYWYKTTALACLSSLVAYFVYGIFDTIALGAKPGFLFWMLLGIVAGLHKLAIRKNPHLVHLPQ